MSILNNLIFIDIIIITISIFSISENGKLISSIDFYIFVKSFPD